MGMEAKFYIEYQTDDYMYIIDTGIEEKSVQKDGKNVVAYLSENHNLGCRRLIYRNRHGMDYEIRHKGGKYVCSGVGHDGIELPPESERLKECTKKLKELRYSEL